MEFGFWGFIWNRWRAGGFDYLRRIDIKKTKIGSGGELQITDAIFLSSKINEVWGYKFSGKRYDCGNKIGFLKAQIATAFKDKDIKKEIKKFIKSLGG